VAETAISVFKALGAVMDEVQAVGKKNRNTEQGYNFRGIDAVINAVGPAFRKHGIIAVPMKSEAAYRDVLTTREKRSRECTVSVTYRFYGPAGDFIDAEVPGESMDFGDKGAAKAMSVAYRIALLQVLCIPTDEPDPDAQSFEREAEEDPNRAQQMETFGVLLGRIDAAADETALMEHGGAVKKAMADDEITPMQYDRLARRASERLAEFRMAVSGDSTSDSHRGRAEPGPTGEGPGPDGERVAVSGPGGDEEPGPVRPGVQPSLHRRPGVGGSAQAPRDRGDAPAAVGGGR
jgi:hypothetical protein